MQVQVRVRGVVLRLVVLGEGLGGGAAALDLELASLQREDLGFRAGEGVEVVQGQLGAVLLCGAGEEFEGEVGAEGDFEAPLPKGLESDCAGLGCVGRLLFVVLPPSVWARVFAFRL